MWFEFFLEQLFLQQPEERAVEKERVVSMRSWTLSSGLLTIRGQAWSPLCRARLGLGTSVRSLDRSMLTRSKWSHLPPSAGWSD